MSDSVDSVPAVGGVHLVGSVPLPDQESVMQKCSDGLPKRLLRVSDGETGDRCNYITNQIQVLQPVSEVLLDWNYSTFDESTPQKISDADITDKLKKVTRLELGYEAAAIPAYQQFCRGRDSEGLFSPTTKFQVCIPTPTNVVGCFIKVGYRQIFERFYADWIFTEMHNIQAAIPKHDLAIQIDLAVDMSILEGLNPPWWDTEVTSTFDGIVERVVQTAKQVESEVDIGFHLCYGDINHKHWKEPEDTSLMVKFAAALIRSIPRQITWIHLPVPISRDDDEYFAALSELESIRGKTMLYLGLVHANDLEGSKKRLHTAQKIVKGGFGIATECGMGRTPAEELDSIFSISTELSAPVA